MKYLITRTSVWAPDAPCTEAFLYPREHWELRTCSEEDFNRRFSKKEGTWRSKGKNHKITEEGYITRQVDDVTEWVVEMNTLEELNAFADKYGKIIISPIGEVDDEFPEIEIYDDYRE